jgi:hypothetical protein
MGMKTRSRDQGRNGRGRFGEETFAGVRGNGQSGHPRREFIRMPCRGREAWVDKRERCRLHRTRGWRDSI